MQLFFIRLLLKVLSQFGVESRQTMKKKTTCSWTVFRRTSFILEYSCSHVVVSDTVTCTHCDVGTQRAKTEI